MNAMSFQTVGPLYEALAQVGADNDTWAVVLTAPAAASAPVSISRGSRHAAGCDGLPMSRIAIRAMEYMSNPYRRCGHPQPIVAAVNGPAYGGGMCLMLAPTAPWRPIGALMRRRHHQWPDRHGDSASAGCYRG